MVQFVLQDRNFRQWFLNSGPVRLKRGGIKGLGLPSYGEQVTKTATLPGQQFNGYTVDARGIWMTLAFSGPRDQFDGFDATADTTGTQREFWDGLSPDAGDMRLYVYDGDAEIRWIELRLRDDGGLLYTQNPDHWSGDPFVLNFTADDPFWHTDRVTREFSTPEDEVDYFGGAAHIGPPYYVMGSSTTGTGTIDNPGDEPVWLTYVVNGPAASYSLGGISGSLALGPDDYLIADGREGRKSVLRYTSDDGGATHEEEDVTFLMDSVGFVRVPPGSGIPIDVVLIGTGTAEVSLIPSYRRAF